MRVFLGFLAICNLSLCLSAFPKKPRIIGGAQSTDGQFPFAAAVFGYRSSDNFLCGGTLVSNQWVLTAGQCVNGVVSFTVQLGSNTLSGPDDNRLMIIANEYVLHPNYNEATLENDLGLVKLPNAVTTSDFVSPLESLATSRLADNAPVTVMGWGQTSDSIVYFSLYLLYVELNSLSQSDCQAIYGNQINDNSLCVASVSNAGPCFGDVGGPLLSGQTLVGVSSFLSGNGCENTDPSGYIRIESFTEWIQSVI